MFKFYLKYKVKIILVFGRGIRIILFAKYEIKSTKLLTLLAFTLQSSFQIPLNNCFLSYKGIKILHVLYILIKIIITDTDINQ